MRHPFDGLERPEVAFPANSTHDSAANFAATAVPVAAGSRRSFLMQSSALAAGVVTFLFGKSAAAQLNFTEERGDGRGDRGGGNRGRGDRDQRGGRNDRGRNDGRGGWNDDRDDDWLGDRDYNWYDRDRFRDRDRDRDRGRNNRWWNDRDQRRNRYTTYALGEEGGRNDWNRRGRRGRNRWWQDNNRWGRGRNRYTTQALFEEGGWGNNQFDWDWWDRDRRRRRGNRNRNRNRYTTYALGEEG